VFRNEWLYLTLRFLEEVLAELANATSGAGFPTQTATLLGHIGIIVDLGLPDPVAHRLIILRGIGGAQFTGLLAQGIPEELLSCGRKIVGLLAGMYVLEGLIPAIGAGGDLGQPTDVRTAELAEIRWPVGLLLQLGFLLGTQAHEPATSCLLHGSSQGYGLSLSGRPVRLELINIAGGRGGGSIRGGLGRPALAMPTTGLVM